MMNQKKMLLIDDHMYVFLEFIFAFLFPFWSWFVVSTVLIN